MMEPIRSRLTKTIRRAALISGVFGFLFGVLTGMALVGAAINLPGVLTEDVAKLRKEVGLFKMAWRGR